MKEGGHDSDHDSDDDDAQKPAERTDAELTSAEKLLYIILRTSVLANMGYPAAYGATTTTTASAITSSGSTSSTETLIRKKGRGESADPFLWPHYRSTKKNTPATSTAEVVLTAEQIFQKWGTDTSSRVGSTAMPLPGGAGPRCWLTPATITMIERDVSLKRQMRWSSTVDPVVHAILMPDPIRLSGFPSELSELGGGRRVAVSNPLFPERAIHTPHSSRSLSHHRPSIPSSRGRTLFEPALESISWGGGGAPGSGFYTSSADVEQLFQSTPPAVTAAASLQPQSSTPVFAPTPTHAVNQRKSAKSAATCAPAFVLFHDECPPVVIAAVHVALHRCVVGVADPYWLTVIHRSSAGRSEPPNRFSQGPPSSASASPSKSRLKRFALSNPVIVEPYIKLNGNHGRVRPHDHKAERGEAIDPLADQHLHLDDEHEPVVGGAAKRWKSDHVNHVEDRSVSSALLPRGLLTLLSESCECGTLVLRLQRLCDLAELPERRPALGSYGECALDALRHALDLLRRHAQDLSLTNGCRTPSMDALLAAHRALDPLRDAVFGLADVFGVSTEPEWDGSQALLRLSSATLLSTLYERFMVQQANTMEDYLEALFHPQDHEEETGADGEVGSGEVQGDGPAINAGSAQVSSPPSGARGVVSIGFGHLLGYLLRALLHPLSRMITEWLTRGICTDPLDEFFIVPSHGRTACGFMLDTSPHRLPIFLSTEAAAFILHAGLSVRALREASSMIVNLATAASQPDRLSGSTVVGAASQSDRLARLSPPSSSISRAMRAKMSATANDLQYDYYTTQDACAAKWMVQEFVDSLLGRTTLLAGETERGTRQRHVPMPTADLFSALGRLPHWRRFYDACNAVLAPATEAEEEQDTNSTTAATSSRRSSIATAEHHHSMPGGALRCGVPKGSSSPRGRTAKAEGRKRAESNQGRGGAPEMPAAVPLNSASLEALRAIPVQMANTTTTTTTDPPTTSAADRTLSPGRPAQREHKQPNTAASNSSSSTMSHITIVMHSDEDEDIVIAGDDVDGSGHHHHHSGLGDGVPDVSGEEEGGEALSRQAHHHRTWSASSVISGDTSSSTADGSSGPWSSFGVLSPRWRRPSRRSDSRNSHASDLSTNSSRVSLALYGAIMQEHRHVQRSQRHTEASEQTQMVLKADFLRSARQRRWRERMQAWKLERLTLQSIRQIALMDEVEEIRALYDGVSTCPAEGPASTREEQQKQLAKEEVAALQSDVGGEEHNPWLGRLVTPLPHLPPTRAGTQGYGVGTETSVAATSAAVLPFPFPAPHPPPVVLYPEPGEAALLKRGRVRFFENGMEQQSFNAASPSTVSLDDNDEEEGKETRKSPVEPSQHSGGLAALGAPKVESSRAFNRDGEADQDDDKNEEEMVVVGRAAGGTTAVPSSSGQADDAPAALHSDPTATLAKKRKGKKSKKAMLALEMPTAAAAMPKRRAQLDLGTTVPSVADDVNEDEDQQQQQQEVEDTDEEQMIMEVVEVFPGGGTRRNDEGPRAEESLYGGRAVKKEKTALNAKEEKKKEKPLRNARTAGSAIPASAPRPPGDGTTTTELHEKDEEENEGQGGGTKPLFIDAAGFPHLPEYYKVGDINDEEYFNQRNGPRAISSRGLRQEEIEKRIAKVLETEAREQAWMNTASPAYWHYCEQLAASCLRPDPPSADDKHLEKRQQPQPQQQQQQEEKERQQQGQEKGDGGHQNLSTTLRPSSVTMDLSLSTSDGSPLPAHRLPDPLHIIPAYSGVASPLQSVERLRFSTHWANDISQLNLELCEVRGEEPVGGGGRDTDDVDDAVYSSSSSKHENEESGSAAAIVTAGLRASRGHRGLLSHRFALRSPTAFAAYVNTLRLSSSEKRQMRTCSSYYLELGMFTCRYLTHKALQLLLLPPYGPIYRLLVQLIDVFLLQSPMAASRVTDWWHPYASTLLAPSLSVSSARSGLGSVPAILDGAEMLHQLNHLLREESARQLPTTAPDGRSPSMDLTLVLRASSMPSSGARTAGGQSRPSPSEDEDGLQGPPHRQGEPASPNHRSRRRSKRHPMDSQSQLRYRSAAPPSPRTDEGRPQPAGQALPQPEGPGNEEVEVRPEHSLDLASRFLPRSGEAGDEAGAAEGGDPTATVPRHSDLTEEECGKVEEKENQYTNPIDFLNDLSVHCKGPPHVRWLLPSETLDKAGDLFCSLLLWKSMEQLVTQTWKTGLESGVPDVFFFCNVARQVFIGIQQHLWDSLGRYSTAFRETISLKSPSLYHFAHLEQFTMEMDHFLERCRYAALLTSSFQPCRGLLYEMLRQTETVFQAVTRCNGQLLQLRDELLEKLETVGPDLDPKELLRNDPYVVVSPASAVDRHAPKYETMPSLHKHSSLWQPFKELQREYNRNLDTAGAAQGGPKRRAGRGGGLTARKKPLQGHYSRSPPPRSSPAHSHHPSPRASGGKGIHVDENEKMETNALEADASASRSERLLQLVRVAMNEVLREQYRQREVIQDVVRRCLRVFCDLLQQLREVLEQVGAEDMWLRSAAPESVFSNPPTAHGDRWNAPREQVDDMHHLEVLTQHLKQLEDAMRHQINASS